VDDEDDDVGTTCWMMRGLLLVEKGRQNESRKDAWMARPRQTAEGSIIVYVLIDRQSIETGGRHSIL